MSHLKPLCVAALALLGSAGRAAADDQTGPAAVVVPLAPASTTEARTATVTSTATVSMGARPLDTTILARQRGAADVYNDMQLKGMVADNKAINVTTGNNIITDGAFANSAGVPMVVQNSGNNVLIQNATIVNVQVN